MCNISPAPVCVCVCTRLSESERCEYDRVFAVYTFPCLYAKYTTHPSVLTGDKECYRTKEDVTTPENETSKSDIAINALSSLFPVW